MVLILFVVQKLVPFPKQAPCFSMVTNVETPRQEPASAGFNHHKTRNFLSIPDTLSQTFFSGDGHPDFEYISSPPPTARRLPKSPVTTLP